jgi:hypothetical protein
MIVLHHQLLAFCLLGAQMDYDVQEQQQLLMQDPDTGRQIQ